MSTYDALEGQTRQTTGLERRGDLVNLPKCCYAMPLGHLSCSRRLDGTGLLTGQPTNSNASSKKIQKDPKRRFQLGCGPCQIVLPGQMSQGLQALLVSEALGQAHLRHLTPQRYTIMFALFASPLSLSEKTHNSTFKILRFQSLGQAFWAKLREFAKPNADSQMVGEQQQRGSHGFKYV